MKNDNDLSVRLQYSPLFDRECSKIASGPTPEDVEKLRDLLPDIRNDWEQMGSVLCKELRELTGKSFFNNEFMVTLFLNENFSNMSLPLIINCQFLVKDFSQKNRSLFVSLLFHILLHHFVAAHGTQRKSLFLRGQKELSILAQNHLHLFTLQHRVYESLGQMSELQVIQDREREESPEYSKAWDMVLEDKNNQELWEEILS